MIKRLGGYAAGKDRNTNITYNFFVDDLKRYNSTTNGIKKQLDLVTRFSQDIGMNFGQVNVHILSLKRDKSNIMSKILK